MLAGCATLSREECLSGNWYELGVRDGQTGEPLSLLQRHREACQSHGIWIDPERYRQGRERGLQYYCTFENALYSGLQGHTYYGVCPPDIEPWFRRHHAIAYEVYRARSDLESVDQELSSKENTLLEKELSDQQRVKLRQEIHDLDRKRERLRDDLYARERELDRLREDVRWRGKY